jgi:hypothetical protein
MIMRTSPGSTRRASVAVVAMLLLATISAWGCASSGNAGAEAEQARSVRKTLMLGPKGLRVPAQILWMGTIGLVTTPVWLPVLAYERVSEDDPELRLTQDPDPFSEVTESQEAGSLPLAPPEGTLDLGSYHALIVGNVRYRQLPSLKTALADARRVAFVLESEYAFSVKLLVDATRADLVNALHALRSELGPTANLLIYYAGHGYLDEDTGEGYWLPIDADPDQPTNWLSNATITTMIKGLEAKHVLVVSDSCFSGTLNRSADIRAHPPSYLYRLARKRARVVLTSGGLEPVQDDGGGGNSVFARYFVDSLLENDRPAIEGSALFLRIRQPVLENAFQTPEYGPIRLAGHEGGDFIFVRTPSAAPAP